jgi:alpha-NAC-related protein
MFNMDPKKMQAAMKQMGISQENIEALRVIIEQGDNKKIIIENPSVTKMKVQGQESFQISGEVKEEESVSEEDLKTVMEKTGCSKEDAKKVLEKTGDLAEAILEMSS